MEKGHPATVETIRRFAQTHGNSVELIEGSEVYDTLHLIGDVRGAASHADFLANLPGVERVWRISSSYKNIARVVGDGHRTAVHRPRRVVEVGGPDGHVRRIGAGKHVFLVGPDSVQTEEQTMTQARMLAQMADRLGIRDRVVLRAGAFKPRTRPTDFRGLGMEGIHILDRVRQETGLPYVTEVMDHTLVGELSGHVDMFQIGTRNAQDFALLEAVGTSGKPVLLKRGFGNDAEEWFNAAEYVANQGNLDIVLCERGVKTMFARNGYNRFTPDFNVLRHARDKTILPVAFDPSHAAGDDRLVAENLLAAAAFLPDASITEVIHSEDFRAEQLCDARQALLIQMYAKAVEAVLQFERHVQPWLQQVDDYFERRRSPVGVG
ncbi:MAG: N-acetylneuraminate synthase family protein [Candidatus Eremiobacterota bacterium]